MARRYLIRLLAISLMAIAAPVGSAQTGAADPRFMALARAALSPLAGDRRVPGLQRPVEVLRDRWGVPHIYAENTEDLFFAQGYVVAQDRLWQMELWRRQREGRLAEIVGPDAVARDRTARLLRYRGPMDDREWTSYHPLGKRIFTAFAAGVNAFIAERAANLPVEFVLTGVRPEPWTAETLVLRAGTFGDATAELTLARNVARLGSEEANRQRAPDPFELLVVPDGLDVSIIDDAVSTGGRGGGRGGGVPELVEPYRSWARGGSPPAAVALAEGGGVLPRGAAEGEPGSNNWVVSGRLSATGSPVVVNDPHRDVTNPSLRYISHLVAPGWNVIGASEPPFVGVHIGHNDRLGWGLTIVGTDQEDVYVEALNPADPGLVRWRDGWEPLRRVREEIRVKGQAPVVVDLQFSRHGPIFHVDGAGHRAYALRSASMEPGTAPYLAGLRLAQARDCRMFLSEAMYWKAPSENLICGDRDGHISWQASALTPKRGRDGRLWSGRLPVPGTGGYEWDGFRSDLPREIDPPRGFVATANHNIHPPGYGPPIMFKTSTSVPFDRITRLLELLDPGRQFTIDDHRTMQLDALSLRARAELSLFRGWVSADARVERARAALAAWDAVLSRESLAAALHSTWRDLASPAERDVARPIVERQRLHEGSLARAVERLTATQGADWAAWRWGRMHTRALPHALVAAYSLPTIERRGGAGTLAADGASFREILDVADWDRSIVTNVPGQSGQPGSPFYDNLLRLFESDEYFPLVYTRSRVERETTHRLRLGSDLELQHRAK